MKKRIVPLLCAVSFVLLVLQPQTAAAAVQDGLELSVRVLIPSLLPYLILSSFIIRTRYAEVIGTYCGTLVQKLFGIAPQGAAALLLGSIGGYPLGAQTAVSLYEAQAITHEDCRRLLFFCSNAGPSFLLGMIGGTLYHSPLIGFSLWGIHLLSALLCGLCQRRPNTVLTIPSAHQQHNASPDMLFDAIDQGGRTVLKISLFVTAFSVPLGFLRQWTAKLPIVSTIANCILELSSGCCAVAESALPFSVQFILLSAALAWGGFCIHGQTAAIVKSRTFYGSFFRGKLLQTVFSVILAIPVGSVLRAPSMAAFAGTLPASVSTFSYFYCLPPIFFLLFLKIHSWHSAKHPL